MNDLVILCDECSARYLAAVTWAVANGWADDPEFCDACKARLLATAAANRNNAARDAVSAEE